jgi:ATP-dependent Clp protease adaptor protein ClpS
MSDKLPDLLEAEDVRAEDETEEPPMYKVLIHNDDFTTKAFVVELLVVVFSKSIDAATDIMWQAHRNGTGLCGVYTKDVAETKIKIASTMASDAGFPLKLSMEED